MEIKSTTSLINADIGQAKNSTNKALESAKSSSASTASSVGASDLTLTDTAKQLMNLQNALGSTSDVDTAKVGEIRSAIADGSYEIDSRKLADKLIESSLELP